MKISILSLTLQSAIYGRTDLNFRRCQESLLLGRIFIFKLVDFVINVLFLQESNPKRIKSQNFGTDFLVMIFLKT